MSIPVNLNPLLVLPAHLRPSLEMSATAHPSLLWDMYAPIIDRQRKNISNLPDPLIEYVTRAALAAFRQKEETDGKLSFFSDLALYRTHHLPEKDREHILQYQNQRLMLWESNRYVHPFDAAINREQWVLLDYLLGGVIVSFSQQVTAAAARGVYKVSFDPAHQTDNIVAPVAYETWAYICQHADLDTMADINIPPHILEPSLKTVLNSRP